MMRLHILTSIALAAVALAWSTAPVATVGRPGITPVACPQQSWVDDDPSFEELPGAKAFHGRYDGGLYQIEIPERWNGELMLSAHGFVSNGGERGSRLRVRPPLIREHVIEQGFAWAASSYRCNGYVPGVGLQDTMALTDMVSRFAGGRAPSRVYLTGGSMGGHVTLLGMHEFPTAFAGGLAMCPAGPELFDYFTAVAAGAEVVTGLQFTDPRSTADVVRRMSGLLGDPQHLTAQGRQLASLEIELSGGPRPFAVEGLRSRFIQNISGGGLAGSQSPSSRVVTNQHYRYTIAPSLGLTSESLDAQVRRKAPDAAVRGADGPFDELVPFDGRIQRPVISMHGTGDLFVPIHLQRTLRRAVHAAGTDDLLVQRIYRIGGHCGFNATEQARSFDDLVTWVRNGARPSGDDVMADFTDAGRGFTSPLRAGDPGTLTVTPGLTTMGEEAR